MKTLFLLVSLCCGLLAQTPTDPIGGSTGGGASTTPGTPVHSVQFNNPLGTFAGDANFTWDGAQLRDKLGTFFGPDEVDLPPLLQQYWSGATDLITAIKPGQNDAAFAMEAVSTFGVAVVLQGKSTQTTPIRGMDADVYAGNDNSDVNGLFAYVSSNGFNVASLTGTEIFVDASGGGSVIDNRGLWIHDITGATNNYAIKTGLGLARFGDTVFAGPEESALPMLLQGYVGGGQLFATNTSSTNALGIETTSANGIFIAQIGISSFAVGVETDMYAGEDNQTLRGFATYLDSNGKIGGSLVSLFLSSNNSAGASANTAIEISDQTGATNNWAIKTSLGLVEFGDVVKYSGAQSTGSGSALLGTNSPATILTAPYKWIEAKTADGTQVYIPAWK